MHCQWSTSSLRLSRWWSPGETPPASPRSMHEIKMFLSFVVTNYIISKRRKPITYDHSYVSAMNTVLIPLISLLIIATALSVTIHYTDVITGVMASQITSLTSVYSTGNSGVDQRKHISSASLAFVRGIHQGPVNSSHKWPIRGICFHLMTSSCIRHKNVMTWKR